MSIGVLYCGIIAHMIYILTGNLTSGDMVSNVLLFA